MVEQAEIDINLDERGPMQEPFNPAANEENAPLRRRAQGRGQRVRQGEGRVRERNENLRVRVHAIREQESITRFLIFKKAQHDHNSKQAKR